MHEDKIKKKEDNSCNDVQVLTIHVRSDLYRAFRRCVWMTVYETGLPIVEVHNMLIEELLKKRGC